MIRRDTNPRFANMAHKEITMSKEDLSTIVNRALTDEEFRAKLLSDIDAALEGDAVS